MMKRQHLNKPARPRASNQLFTDVVGELGKGGITVAHIRHPHLFVFGDHDPKNGKIRINTPLFEVMTYLHEACHRARPSWSERAVRIWATRLLKMLDDDGIADLHRRLRKAMKQAA
jgi:hypothetical protein